MKHTSKEFEQMREDLKRLPDLSICANCGSTEHLHLHHIVPLSLGGTNRFTNIVALCETCHGKLHGSNWEQHSEGIKKGMAKAKAQGKQIGRPELTIEAITSNDKFMNAYKLYKSKNIKKIDIQRLTGLSRVTIDKYIKVLEG